MKILPVKCYKPLTLNGFRFIPICRLQRTSFGWFNLKFTEVCSFFTTRVSNEIRTIFFFLTIKSKSLWYDIRVILSLFLACFFLAYGCTLLRNKVITNSFRIILSHLPAKSLKEIHLCDFFMFKKKKKKNVNSLLSNLRRDWVFRWRVRNCEITAIYKFATYHARFTWHHKC